MPVVTHTLSGTDLEALLARVPEELGPEATIVAANKLRSGGLGGFFAKEQYEVIVEVPEDDPEPPAAMAAPGLPRMSTEAHGFASVLDRMVRDAGAADELRPVGPAMASHRAAPLVAAPAAIDDQDELVDDEPFEPMLPAELARITTPAAAMPAAPAAAPVIAPPAMPAPAPAPVVAGPIPAPIGSDLPALDQGWLAQVGLPAEVASHVAPIERDPMSELQRLMERLVTPEPLPKGRGSVIAVIGDRTEVLEVTERFAAQLGLHADDVLVAAQRFRGNAIPVDRRIDSIDDALEQRRGWRRRTRPTIIAIDAPPSPRQAAWAQHLLDAIEPTMVWGVVDAARKPEDIRTWAIGVGGLDALAVNGLEDTVSPAAVLNVGVPVGLLDGHEATAARWTSILAEHLELVA